MRFNVGDRVRHDRTDWLGTIERVLGPARSAGGARRVRVRWDRSGASGTEFEARLHLVEPAACACGQRSLRTYTRRMRPSAAARLWLRHLEACRPA